MKKKVNKLTAYTHGRGEDRKSLDCPIAGVSHCPKSATQEAGYVAEIRKYYI